MFRLIIFDFDGVLALSNEAHVEAARRALDKAGVRRDVPQDELTSHFGKPYKVILKLMMGDEYSKEKLDLAYEYHHDIIHSQWFLENIKPVPGLREFLQKLKGDGMKLAIATGNERSFLDRTMDYLNLDGLFDLTLCAEDVENSKPAPDIVLKAVEFFQVDKGDALFVGDAKSDILAAKGAGVTSVAVLSGVLDKEGAEELKPDFIVDDILDIYSITVNK